MKTLAIDDDRDFLNLLNVYLKKIGHTTTLIDNASDILKTITRESYDLVLVDWMMPEVDGITIIKAIRTRDEHLGTHTHIIMVTAINNTMAKSYAKRSGADSYVAKVKNAEKFKSNLFDTIESLTEKQKTQN